MATKSRSKAVQFAVDKAKGKDVSPKWDGHESWSADQFMRQFRLTMDFYRLDYSGKDLKPKVVMWMQQNGYTKEQIKAFKDTKDNRSNLTMGSIAANLLKGMPAVRAEFNDERDTTAWLREQIARVVAEGKDDEVIDDTIVEEKPDVHMPSIQERLRDTAYAMTEELEDALESFQQDPDAFDPKSFKVLNLLRGKQAKAAHARVIKDFYIRQYDEYLEVADGKCDQLKEAYSHLNKAQVKKITQFYSEIISACDMLAQEAKINRKPRAKKPTDKNKLVSKVKYLKQDDKLKLVSINPEDVIGAKELWVFNVKTRKLGKYVASEFSDLSIKGTSIVNFDENKSIAKTLRKPEEQLKEFKAAGKVALRKFLDDIKAVDIKLNGRINEETMLLRVQ